MEADTALADRMCIVTRDVADESELLRFVRAPDGAVVPDLARRLPGRGVWVGLSRARVDEAVRKKLFSRGFGVETRAEPMLADLTGALLRKAAISYLSLAKKAGEAVAGAEKVAEMAASGRARVVLHAVEAAANGREKIDTRITGEVEILSLFTSSEMDLAFGRTNVIHAAVARGGLSEKLLAAVRRVRLYETPPGTKTGKDA
ncbi:RNA-binding protein [soil metagenome]